jgi:osmotically-inducible protein OsmY
MPSTPTEPDDYLIGRVQEALAHDPRLNELDVTVTITGGGVFLNGTVTTDERCRAITEVVRRELPGLEVHNEVGVVSLTEPETAEELK